MKRLRDATQDKTDILSRIKEREEARTHTPADENKKQKNETQREFLIRTGKINPFDQVSTEQQATTSSRSNYIYPGTMQADTMSHQNLHVPSHKAIDTILPSKRKVTDDNSDEDYKEDTQPKEDNEEHQEDEYLDEDDLPSSNQKHIVKKLDEIYEDDGSEVFYKKRLNDWIHNRKIMRYRVTHPDLSLNEVEEKVMTEKDDNEQEQFQPHPNFEDANLNSGMSVPGELWDCLFDYQKTCKSDVIVTIKKKKKKELILFFSSRRALVMGATSSTSRGYFRR